MRFLLAFFFVTFSLYPQTVFVTLDMTETGITAGYDFTGADSLADKSGNGHTLTAQGILRESVIEGTPCLLTNSADNSYVELETPDDADLLVGTGEFYWDMWVYNPGNSQIVLGYRRDINDIANGVTLYSASGQWAIRTGDGVVQTTYSSLGAEGNGLHYIAIYRTVDDTLRFYHGDGNGFQVLGYHPENLSGGFGMALGSGAEDPTSPATVWIAQARFFTGKSFTDEEIANIYTYGTSTAPISDTQESRSNYRRYHRYTDY